MNNTTEYEVELKLKMADRTTIPVTVRLQMDGRGGIKMSCIGPAKDDAQYEVSFFVTRIHDRKRPDMDECYACVKPRVPCPPNELTQVNCLPPPFDNK